MAVRVTFVGELGWELHCSAEYGAALWSTLVGTGAQPCGYRAIESLRLEKGYRVWGSDIGPDTTPDEAGLGFAVRRGDDFAGAAAVHATRARGVTRRLRCLVLDDARAIALGGEPVRLEPSEPTGSPFVGAVTSGGYGYTVARSIAYSYLPADVAQGAPVAVQVDGTWVTGTVAPTPLYDPTSSRVRA
jgi:4-methylaminobutanoate oxidase (formaldehyde-forming)